MAGVIRNIAVFSKKNNEAAEDAACYITKLLTDAGIGVFCIAMSNENDTSIGFHEFQKMNVDMIFAMGGDGTTLRALRIIPYNVPLFSINVGGHRGILSEATMDHIEQTIADILNGNYSIESSIRISTTLNGVSLPPALNDILFCRSNMTRTPTISIRFNNDIIIQKMDGLILSTPIGSTGHSLSLGGPIVHELLDCFILSPIAPLSRIPKLIIDPREIEISSNYKMQLILDGQKVYQINEQDRIRIELSCFKANFIRLRKKGFRQIEKLGFK